jgi:diaminohydroxyphosphoribosylaminopyrimidine deaminase/5-amino-6-(5-phosphoribosylamino)uracil reductase
MSDNVYMQKALDLAVKGKGSTSPNPMVGAVIVKGGRIIGEGYHKKSGMSHAEISALKKAGKRAKGATLYVNLEPCCHTDKKTPPCTNSIIRAGIKRVVAAMTDPNPNVSGKGIRELRKAGIETTVGVMRKEAARLNEVFTKFILKKEPFVILKIAQSIDGKIATARGESKWITGPKSRQYVQALRNEFDSVLTGIGTVTKDDPSLDCRIRGGKNPFRIIVDSTLKISPKAKLLMIKDSRVIVATTSKADPVKKRRLASMGASVLVVKSRYGKVNLQSLMKELGLLGITSVMIEGGSSIAASAISSRIVDKVLFFIAPKIIGGTKSVSAIGGSSPSFLSDALELKKMNISKYGEDILIEGYPVS